MMFLIWPTIGIILTAAMLYLQPLLDHECEGLSIIYLIGAVAGPFMFPLLLVVIYNRVKEWRSRRKVQLEGYQDALRRMEEEEWTNTSR